MFVHVVRHVYVCYAPCLEASCNTNHTIRCGLHSQCSGCCAIAMIASPHQLLFMCHTFPLIAWVYHRRRPYRVECTGSLLTSEVKQRRARSVLGWGTAWEDLRVLSAFVHVVRFVCLSKMHIVIDGSVVFRRCFKLFLCVLPKSALVHKTSVQMTDGLRTNLCCRRRPYRVECTGSLSTSEVKLRRARSVLGWGTAWEDLRVLSAFSILCVIQRLLQHAATCNVLHCGVGVGVNVTVAIIHSVPRGAARPAPRHRKNGEKEKRE